MDCDSKPIASGLDYLDAGMNIVLLFCVIIHKQLQVVVGLYAPMLTTKQITDKLTVGKEDGF